MRSYLLLIAFSFVVSYLSVPMVRSIGERFTANQKLRARDQHENPIVKFGGVGIVASLLAGLGLASQIPFFRGVFSHPRPLIGIVIALLMVLILGLADDLLDLKWFIKLAGQFLIGGVIVFHDIRVEALPVGWLHLEHPALKILLTIVLIAFSVITIKTMVSKIFSAGCSK